ADVVWTLDENYVATYVSPSITPLTGIAPEDFMAGVWMESMTPEARAVVTKDIESRAMEQGVEEKRYLLEFTHKDGNMVWLESLLRPLVDGQGRFKGILGVSRDVTQRKRAEDELARSEAQYRLLADTMADVIWTMDPNFTFTYASPSVFKMLGYTPEEFLVLSREERYPAYVLPLLEEYAERILDALARDDVESLEQRLELEMLRKDGTALWVEVVWSPMLGLDRELLGFSGVTRDIDARRRAEAALREMNETYRLLSETMIDGIATLDEDLNVNFASPSMERFMGYSAHELMELPFKTLLAPDSFKVLDGLLAGMQLCINDGQWETLPSTVDLQCVRKDGSTVWAELVWSPIFNEAGVFQGVTGVTRDIEARRRAEAALRERDETYRLLSETMLDGIATLDAELNPDYVSPSMARLLGYDLEELRTMWFDTLLTPESFQVLAERLSEVKTCLATGQWDALPSTLELEYVRKDGSTVWTELAWSPIHDENGVFQGVTGVTRDIEARRKTEQALRQSKERFRLLADNARAMVFRMSLPQGTYEYISPAVEHISGYAPQEYYDNPGLTGEILHPDWQGYFASIWEDLRVREHAPPRYECPIIHKDGGVRWLEQFNTLLRDGQGKLVALQGIVLDITQRKEAEAALATSEERYRELAENTRALVYRMALPEGNYEYVSPASEFVIGYTPEELYAKPLIIRDVIHPDWHDYFSREWENLL
ncbi:MAG: PAS domain S-box protein, partial [Desulfovibrio sp.]